MNLLEFANPAGWWWAALALPILLLYVLRIRLRRQPVSTLLFWDQLFDEKKPRAWWQQLRHLVSLLLQLLFLLLLVLALVDPLWQWQKSQRRKVLLVIDNSASMSAKEGDQTRLAKAKQAAASLVRSLRVGDEMAILAAGGKPEVAIGLTDHSRSLLEAIDRIEATDAPSALLETVAAARRLLPNEKGSNLYVLTDGCDEATESLAEDKTLTLMGFGTDVDNLAITQFQVRRSLLDAIGYQTLIEVTNYSRDAKKCRLELALEDQLVDVVPIELESGASRTLNLDHASASGGRLVATLDSEDAFRVDDRALAVLPTRRPLKVTLVTSASMFLKSVLEAIPLVDLQMLKELPADFSSANFSKSGVTVFHQAVPNPLPQGKLLVIDPRNNCDLWNVGQLIEQPMVASVDPKSPITAHVKLTNVLFPDARELTFNGTAETLIKTPLDQPLLSHISRPGGDVLVLNVELDKGDLPLRIAFPVMMKNALEWFEGSHGELRPSVATGHSASLRLPESSSTVASPSTQTAIETSPTESKTAESSSSPTVELKAVTKESRQGSAVDYWLRDPQGELLPLSHDDQTATLAIIKRAGLWSVGTKEDLARDPWLDTRPSNAADTLLEPSEAERRLSRLACNLSSRSESDLRPRTTLQPVEHFGLASLGGRSIWFYCVLLALVFTAVEWWLYQRRIVG